MSESASDSGLGSDPTSFQVFSHGLYSQGIYIHVQEQPARVDSLRH